MEQKYIKLYDEYTHSNDISRRDFVDRLIKLTGSAALAMTLLPSLENNNAIAQTVSKDDKAIVTKYIEYQGESGKMRGYLATPKKVKKDTAAVVVIHENRGLNAHIEDVARRVSLAGFIALAPDALSPLGNTPDDMDKARELIGKLDRDKTLKDFIAAVEYLKTYNKSTRNVGCVGFCWGGSMANQLAVNSADMKAAVAYYGGQPKAEDVAKVKGAVLLHYAGLDERINAGIPAYEEALNQAKVKYELYKYEGVNHAFNNDTNEARYDPNAAKLAWERTIKFFNDNLKGKANSKKSK
jgi:carboxymethylenebutenolidase